MSIMIWQHVFTGKYIAVETEPEYRYKRSAYIQPNEMADAKAGHFENNPELTLELNLGFDDPDIWEIVE